MQKGAPAPEPPPTPPLAPSLMDRLDTSPPALDRDRERVPLPETKWSDTPFNARVFDLFKLIDFDKTELSRAFDRLDKNKNGIVEPEELRAYMREIGRRDDRERVMSDKYIAEFAEQLMTKLDSRGEGVTRARFNEVILGMANTVDPRVWPITISMVLTGVAVGIVIPVMPLFVTKMGLSSADFGLVVSAFGLSKLIGNIPCAFLSDKYGRKRVMTGGAALMALGMMGVGFASSLPELMVARLVTGLGSSGFTTASMLYLMDIGTPFTRTKTMAPISAGFSAGAALGPALGGFLAHSVGLSSSFALVSASFLFIMGLNHKILTETHVPGQGGPVTSGGTTPGGTSAEPPTLRAEVRETVRQWRPLLADAQFNSVLGINFMYWLALSGSYMTLLPLMLVREELGLSPSEVGGVFAMLSAVSVVCTPPSAAIADRFGKPPAIVVSSSIVSAAIFAFPMATQLPPALGILAIWSLGATMFGMAPTAHVTDIVPNENRSQALALLRTTGDVGLLVGASCTGLMAHYSSPELAMQANAALLLACGTAFGAVTYRHGFKPGAMGPK
ncbi:Synaptic vesicle glycoprotein 2B [Hondaea fermentalgiana]|uniref:Synaptic vesicle glycoprotein 2B n=1 Tax=Hondaea fermentalgiana TaxID=2315210 RepID=A0A2R5GVW1_9STRA|nr:Synaptic vesicle glycoprotein 2B [Hondaea fermentalgiana]|eukprot:GBG32803.1 Synaptic vesicle glycoprotein 2B [Hondaea fermentalgiana]